MKLNPLHLCDSYKLGHMAQYPEGTEYVYSNLTARSLLHAPILEEYKTMKILWFGLQGVLMEMLEMWDERFFDLPWGEIEEPFARRVEAFVGPSGIDISKFKALHELGYLPLCIKALPEGVRVSVQVPLLTIVNTLPEFYWLTNYVETYLSAELWKSVTSATIAKHYRTILESYAERTGAPADFINWQAHDFSMRGMSGVHDAAKSGAGHLVSFLGTDCLPALDYLCEYYGGGDTFLGGSVPATEHSVMCMGGNESEIDTFKRLITKVYPDGIVSIVSDTWDFWRVLTEYSVILKDDILNRGCDSLGNSKVVFRPDSGNPIKILTGYFSDEINYYDGVPFAKDTGNQLSEAEIKGAVECLYDIFGGSSTMKGFKTLNPKVGLIYGDSITPSRAISIVHRLKMKCFASTNVVLGIGSYTYQHVTRDSLGMAIKATSGVINGKRVELFKDPKTDNGVKKSARGLLRVEWVNGSYKLFDQQTEEQEKGGCLEIVYKDRVLERFENIDLIRSRASRAFTEEIVCQ